jgi:2-amino-4-hydroxy-6-hydroxymethyldihydropteridine diphosphokinase
MRDVYLGLGSNLGDKCANIHRAVELLGEVSQVHQVSSLFKTEPVGNLDQDWFLNCAVEIETALEPRQLLAAALAIEKKLKRVRGVKNGPRTIDIDILFHGGRVVNESGLAIPHPLLHQRLFVLAPLEEICPGFMHPVLRQSVKELLLGLDDHLYDQGAVEKFAEWRLS